MTKAQRLAARAAFIAAFDASRFDEDDVQRDLGFNKSGNVIFDRLLEPAIEYVFPSAIGSALFFQGAYEPGEIALVNMVLSREREPVVLDIGANVGVHAVAWATAHANAKIYAFESSPSEVGLLSRNAVRAGEKIFVVPSAVTGAGAVSIDAFVAEAGLATVSAIKLAVDDSEADILAGARTTIEHLRPALLVEFGRHTRTDSAPERAVAAIVEMGYKPFMIVDGFAVASRRYEPAIRNYLFVDARKRVMLPPFPGPESLLENTIARIETLAHLEERVAGLDVRSGSDAVRQPDDSGSERLRNKDAKIKELEQICDERSRVIGELTFALSKERRTTGRRPEVGAMQELIDEAGALRQICDERQVVIDRIVAESAEQRAALTAEVTILRDACDERQRLLDLIAADAAAQRAAHDAEVAALRAACDERAELIDRLAQDLRSANAAAEAARLEVLEREAAAEYLGAQSLTTAETIATVRSHIETLAAF